MPVRTRFGSEEPSEPAPAVRDPPAAAADSPSPTSPRAPPRSDTAPKRPSDAHHQLGNGSSVVTKKRKVVVFDQEAEDEATAARANGAANPAHQHPAASKRANKLTPEQRKKAKDEAARLLPARQLLPVWAGASTSSHLALALAFPPSLRVPRLTLLCGHDETGKDAILAGIQEHDTVIVLADTGSGKTTRASLSPSRPTFARTCAS